MIKNKLFLSISLFCFVILIDSCVSSPPYLKRQFEKSRKYNTSFQNAWEAAIKSLTISGEFIHVAEKESGIISFTRVIPRNQIETLALAPGGIRWSKAIANISVIVLKENEDLSNITINTKIWGTGISEADICLSGRSAPSQEYEMGSKGVIEKEYLDRIANSIPDTKTYKWLDENSEKKK